MAKVFFSPSTVGFYENDTDYPNLPSDLVEVESKLRDKLLASIVPGKIIGSDKKGNPKLVDAPVAEMTIEDAKRLRLSAYRSESDPLYMEWQYDQTSESEQAWRQKVEEIKERFPLPAVS